MPIIRCYSEQSDQEQVVALWTSVFGYGTAHNEPTLALSKKLNHQDGLLFVADDSGQIAGTTMAGYDGHRGWLYSIAVHPRYRRQGLGSKLVQYAERALLDLGCMKINLQLLETNSATSQFYSSLGYNTEPRISMGKILHQNVPPRSVA